MADVSAAGLPPPPGRPLTRSTHLQEEEHNKITFILNEIGLGQYVEKMEEYGITTAAVSRGLARCLLRCGCCRRSADALLPPIGTCCSGAL